MCVICIKPENVAMPPKERLEAMFDSNKDGCGFMYSRKGKVVIRKGFMKLKHFQKGIKQEGITDKDCLIMHFRIATAGSVNPKNTHPFPVTSDMGELKALRTETEFGIAHNGILQLEHDSHHDLSDTMTFIRDVLAEPTIKKNMFNPAVWYLIEEAIGSSKMVILDKEKKFHLLGDWVLDKQTNDGCYYSNLNFRWRESKEEDKKGVVNYYTYHGGNSGVHDWRDEERWYGCGYDKSRHITGFRGDENAQDDKEFAKGQTDNLVYVDYDETDCPHCGQKIASPKQVACTKCGKVFYRLHDEVIN